MRNERIHKVEVLGNGRHCLEVSKVRKGVTNRTRTCHHSLCVVVNTGCGDVTNLKISLIKTNGGWCGNKTFLSSFYRVVHPLQKIRALQVQIMASRWKE